MKRALLGVAMLCLSGCVSSGTRVTEQDIGAFKRGETTEAQVIRRLGKPNSTTLLSDGTRIDVYAYVHATPDAIDFVPIVGAVAGGASATSTMVSFTFDKDGVLQSYSATSSNANSHTGVGS